MFSLDSFNPFKSSKSASPQEHQAKLRTRHERAQDQEDEAQNEMAEAIMAGKFDDAGKIREKSKLAWNARSSPRMQEVGSSAIRKFLSEGRSGIAREAGGFCDIKVTFERFPDEFSAGFLNVLKRGGDSRGYISEFPPDKLTEEPFQSAINRAFVGALKDKKEFAISELMPHAVVPNTGSEDFQQLSLEAAKYLAKKGWLHDVENLFETGLLKTRKVDDGLRKRYLSGLEKWIEGGLYPSFAAMASNLNLSAEQQDGIRRKAREIFKDKKGFAAEGRVPNFLGKPEVLQEYGFTPEDFADEGVRKAATRRYFKELEKWSKVRYEVAGRGKYDDAKDVMAFYQLPEADIYQGEEYKKTVLTMIENLIYLKSEKSLVERVREIPGFSEEMLQSPEMKKIVDAWATKLIEDGYSGQTIERFCELMKSFGIENFAVSPEAIGVMKSRITAYLKGKGYFDPTTIYFFPELIQFVHTPEIRELAKSRFVRELADGDFNSHLAQTFELPQDFLASERVTRSIGDAAIVYLDKIDKGGRALAGVGVFFESDPSLATRPEIRKRIKKIVEWSLVGEDVSPLLVAIQTLKYKAEDILTPLAKQALEDRLLRLLRQDASDDYQNLENLMHELRDSRELVERTGIIPIVQETIRRFTKDGNMRLVNKLGEIFQVSGASRATPYR